MRFRNVPGDVLEKPRQAQPDPPVGLPPLLRQGEFCRPGIMRRPVTFQEALLDQRIHQTGRRALLHGKNLVKVRQIESLLVRNGIEDDKLMKSDVLANRLVPAAAPYFPGKPHDDFQEFPAVLIDIR